MITTTIRSRSTALIGTVAIAAVVAACSAGAPSAMPVPAPVSPAPDSPVPATPAPASPAPSDDQGSELMPIRVDLASTSGQDVTIDILDRTDTLLGATSGTPGDGVSADSESVRVENVDARTLRLTWSDFPIDNQLHLFVDPVDTGYQLLLIQPAPTGPADAMGEDRVLELAFDHHVSAADVEAHIQEGLDTPG